MRYLEPAAQVLLLLVALLACRGGAPRNDSTTDKPTEGPGAAEPARQTPSQRREQARAEAAEQFPWLATVRDNCARYKDAPNEIKKSAIFGDNTALLGKVTVSGAKGRLSSLTTNKGGSDLRLVIKSGDVEFATESLLSPIKKGTPVYNAAAELRQGACVVFSARNLKASSMAERSRVCDAEYFVDFTSVGPCP